MRLGRYRYLVLAGGLVLAGAAAWWALAGRGAEPGAKVRIGFSSLTPLHTAVGRILQRTDILAGHGLSATFTPYLRGSDQHEACAGGQVDMTFICEVPAMVHLNLLDGLTVLGSPGELGDIALVVSAASDVKEAAGLAGRRIAVQAGASSRLALSGWLAAAGLSGERSPTVEMHRGLGDSVVEALASGAADAGVLWDPWLTVHARRASLRVVEKVPFYSLLAVYADRLSSGQAAALARAVEEALAWGARNLDRAAGMVAEGGKLSRQDARVVLGKNRWLGGKPNPTLAPGQAVLKRLDACRKHAEAVGEVPPGFELKPRLRFDLLGKSMVDSR